MIELALELVEGLDAVQLDAFAPSQRERRLKFPSAEQVRGL